jgi:hypothetical protein
MTAALRAVEDAADLDPDEKVRLVTRMLLGWHEMTEIELGRRLGLPRTSIYNRMQGRTPFSVVEVVKMGEIFRIAPEAFLAGPQALLTGSASRPKIAPGSIKNRGATAARPGVSCPARPVGRLSLVAA